jgi:chromosome segregation ATPase
MDSNNKIDDLEKLVKNKTKQIVREVDKKSSDEERIELMTQFMLDPTSSATKLLEKRREMYELQEALQKDKEKFLEKEDQFKKTEEELRNRDDDFHKKIVEYYKNSFEKKQKENYNFNKKLEDEETVRKLLEEGNAVLQVNNEKLKSDLEELRKISSSLKMYETFLNNVKNENPDNFSDINDIVSKYKTLEDTYKSLKSDEEKKKTSMEKEKVKFKNEKSDFESKINSNLTAIQKLQLNIKEKKEDKKKLENELNVFEANNNSIISSLDQILHAINNIYEMCEKKKEWTKHEIEKKEIDKSDYKKRVEQAKLKLRSIKDYIADYNWIYKSYQEEKEKKKKE